MVETYWGTDPNWAGDPSWWQVPEVLNLPDIRRQMEALYPPLTLSPEELYALQTPEAYRQRAAQYAGLVPTEDPRMIEPSYGFMIGYPGGQVYRGGKFAPTIDTLAPIRAQIAQLGELAAQWAPGVGVTRSREQQAEYERAMEQAMNWQPAETPIRPLPGDYWSGAQYGYEDAMRRYEQQLAALETQRNAWEQWKPVMARAFGPETWEGGGFEQLTPPIQQSLGPMGSRQRMWEPQGSTASNWTYAPRWG